MDVGESTGIQVSILCQLHLLVSGSGRDIWQGGHLSFILPGL